MPGEYKVKMQVDGRIEDVDTLLAALNRDPESFSVDMELVKSVELWNPTAGRKTLLIDGICEDGAKSVCIAHGPYSCLQDICFRADLEVELYGSSKQDEVSEHIHVYPDGEIEIETAPYKELRFAEAGLDEAEFRAAAGIGEDEPLYEDEAYIVGGFGEDPVFFEVPDFNCSLDENMKSWYEKAYSTDDAAEYLKGDITLRDCLEAVNSNADFYDFIGIGDSLIRERIFLQISQRIAGAHMGKHREDNDDITVVYNALLDKWTYRETAPRVSERFAVGSPSTSAEIGAMAQVSDAELGQELELDKGIER